MPYIAIRTSVPKSSNTSFILKELSKEVAELLGKNEKYVMTSILTDLEMTFAGDDKPTCYVELKSIGGLDNLTINKLSLLICKKIEATMDIESDRIYINFEDIPRTSWAWNGRTF